MVLIERSELVARQLQENIGVLGADSVQMVQADALRWLADPDRRSAFGSFDLVFLDPPFAAGLLGPACELLAREGWLLPGARVYLETALAWGLPPLPDGWELIRDRTAGQVRYALAQFHPSATAPDP